MIAGAGPKNKDLATCSDQSEVLGCTESPRLGARGRDPAAASSLDSGSPGVPRFR